MTVGRIRMWLQNDPLDQSTQDVDGLGPSVLVIQRLRQLCHLACVDIGETGMEGCGFRCGLPIKRRRQGCALRFKGIHLCLHAGMLHAVGDGADNIINPFGQLAETAFRLGAR